MRRLLLTLMMLAVFSTASYGDIVTFTISEGSGGQGTFDLFADVTGGTSFGIAGYEFFFNDIDSIQNLSQRTVFDPGVVNSRGFNLLFSPDNDPNLTGVQNSTVAATIVYGFGQPPGAFGAGSAVPVGTPWDAHLLLASGTYSGDPNDIAAGGGGFGAGIVNLWRTNDGEGGSDDPTGVNVINEIIPEPSSVILLGIGLAALVGFRRRK